MSFEQNNTNFPQTLKTYFTTLKYPKDEFLKYHQYIVTQYLEKNILQRGLLIMHAVGTGKSILAASICELYRKLDPNRRIIVLLSKSLVNNFKKNIIKYVNETVKEQMEPQSLPEEIKAKDMELDTTDYEEPITAKGGNDDEILKPYKFVSLNASNMYVQLYKTNKSKEELEFEKKLEEFSELVSQADFLENTLLVVDEAHNLFNSISNGSKNAISLYDTIMATKNIKLIFLSGTPIVNHPFELVPCFNMLKGLIPIGNSKRAQTTTLFPENRDDFDNYFVDYNTLKIKNPQRFQNRIVGLASYFGDKYLKTGATKEGFPKQLPTKIEVIPMSSIQFTSYNTARDFEKEELPGRKRGSARFSEKSEMSSSYRIKTRQICNYAIPEYALGPQKGKKSREKFIEKITSDDIKNVEKYSPKMKKIIDNINNFPHTSGVVYSEFVSGEGLAVFKRILEEKEGYTPWETLHKITGDLELFMPDSKSNPNNIEESESESELSSESESELSSESESDSSKEKDKQSKKGAKKHNNKPLNLININSLKPHRKIKAGLTKSNKEDISTQLKLSKLPKTYAMITGETPIDLRDSIINEFNSEENMHGKLIKLLLISRAGAEGLDLKNARHIHIMEPFWNIARIEQVIARIVRYQSHIKLPPNEQNVQPFIYLSDYPADTPKNKTEEPTTDLDIFTKANQNKIIINDAIHNIIEASIDCHAHYNKLDETLKKTLKCKLCTPNNVQLYHPIISKDFTLPDACSYPEETMVKAHEIRLSETGEKFYYTIDDIQEGVMPTIKLYTFQPSLNGYVQMPKNHPVYSDLIKKILSEVITSTLN